LTIILGQYNLVCRPYGSFAVHLSLPDSDLDIQVDSSLLGYFYLDYLSQRKQVIAALDFLQKIFESQDWISETSLFHNARIPLLTFVIQNLSSESRCWHALRKSYKPQDQIEIERQIIS
jgi:transposase-like protein